MKVDIDFLEQGQTFLCPPDLNAEEAWENGDGWVVSNDDISNKVYEMFNPSLADAKIAFRRVCKTVENLDRAAQVKVHGSIPEAYFGPFEVAEYSISYR